LHDQYEMKCLLKEQEPQEAKKSAFKEKKKSFLCILCAFLMNEMSMRFQVRLTEVFHKKKKKDACAHHMNER